MQEYQVVAFNTATTSTNKIHDDDVARQHGFSGGLVPGVDVYAYMTHPPARAWGAGWLERGSMDARFLTPAYDGQQLTVVPTAHVDASDGQAVTLDVRNPAGRVCATGEARLPGASPGADAAADHAWPPPAPDDGVSQPAGGAPDPRRPAASPDSLAVGTKLTLPPHTFHADRASEYLTDVRDDLALYPEAGVAHPGWLLRDANYLLSSNVGLGPWIHVESAVQHHGLVRDGDVVDARGVVTGEWERRGHRFVSLDLGIFAGGDRLVARVRHTAIYQPRTAG